MHWILLALLLMLGLAWWAHSIVSPSLRALTTEQKARLLDALGTGSRMWSIAMMVAFCGWFAALFYLPPQYWHIALTTLLAGILLLFAASSHAHFQRLKQAGMPEPFLRAFARSRILRWLGAALFFSVVGACLLGFLPLPTISSMQGVPGSTIPERH